MLERNGAEVTLTDWGLELIEQCAPIAAALDAAQGGTRYADAVTAARTSLQQPETLPSARVLTAMKQDFENSFVKFVRARSTKTQQTLLALPFTDELQARFEAMTRESIAEQRKIEQADTTPFEIYRKEYVSPARLGIGSKAPSFA